MSFSAVIPHLIVGDARAAIDFYRTAFGAEEVFRMTDPGDGRIGHAELQLGGGLVMLADEYPDFGAVSPDTIGGSPVALHLSTDDLAADLERAAGAGALVLRAQSDESFGERKAVLQDPFGHRWIVSQTIEAVEPEEMQRRWEAETGG